MPETASERTLPTVAVVEDDAGLLTAIQFALATEGYPVRLFENGEALLEQEDLGDVACFVIDQQLPGMNGLPLVQALQSRGEPGRFVIITTRPKAQLREACWALGVPIVEKPILGESLNACIRGLLAKPLT